MMDAKWMRLFNFSEADLAYNRRGELSPTQLTHWAASRRRTKRVLLIIGLLLAFGAGGFTAWMSLDLREAGDPNWWILPLVGIPFVLLGLYFIYLGVRNMKPVVVASVRGPARLARVERTRSTTTNGVSSTSTYVATEMHIGEMIFSLPDEAFAAFQDGATYAVYFWKGLDTIFSIEEV